MSTFERVIAKAAKRAGAVDPVQPRVAAPSKRDTAGGAVPPGKAGSIDISLEQLCTVGLVAPSDMEQVFAEQFRVIKRPLLQNAERTEDTLPNSNMIVVGSALPGAGKTFTSFNLAMSIANEVDWSVLLVDGDVGRPTLTRSLGVTEAPGLIGLLEAEDADPSDFTYNTNLDGLQFLPAGVFKPHAKELLASQRMEAVLAALRQRGGRQIVVCDSPPLLPTSEARVLARYAGQVVMVVESGVTARRSLLDALDLLDPSKAINLVLNKHRHLPGLSDYYGHYGSYGRYGESNGYARD